MNFNQKILLKMHKDRRISEENGKDRAVEELERTRRRQYRIRSDRRDQTFH